MEKKKIGNIARMSRSLLGHFPKPVDDELEMLINRAEDGQDVAVEIEDLLSRYEGPRRWLKENIKLQAVERSAHSPLAGNQGVILPSQKWVCVEHPREHWLLVMQEGEEAPACPTCGSLMTREEKRKG